MKAKIKAFLVKFVLGFLAVNALLIIVGLFVPLTKLAADGNYMGSGISLLSFDEFRD